jgi:predicted metalloenzyme YecM
LERAKEVLQRCQSLIQTTLANGRVVPYWDAVARTLSVGKQPIKCFHVPAPNQEAILATFQVERWPERIDDPLPIKEDQKPKRRLHEAIKALNRNRRAKVIYFFGDGTGEGVCWRLVHDWR